MKTNPFSRFRVFWMSLISLSFSSVPLLAEQFGLFTYRVVDDTVEITDYPTTEVGDVDIPSEIDGKPVTSIGDAAFRDCRLISITIPSGVTHINDRAFQFCHGLTSVSIPSRVTSIGDRAFGSCSGLESIIVASENPQYDSVDGVLFDFTQTTIIRCPGGRSGAYSIPQGVTVIFDYAFSGCKLLTEITITESVGRIGDSAFLVCSGLTDIAIPEGVTSIGDSAFNGCNGLTSVTIPSTVTSIGHGAFIACSGLTSVAISEGVTEIGNSAFHDCFALTSVTIPSSVTIIGSHAFHNCIQLSSAIIIPSGVTTISVSAFEDCRALTSVIISEGVIAISVLAFRKCSGLTSISIPSSVTRIDSSSFADCSVLESISVEPGNEHYASVEGVLLDSTKTDLLGCPEGKVGEYTIPSSVTSIGDNAFAGCTGLIKVSIPEGVTRLGDTAFAGCTGLTSMTIPESVTSIGVAAFGTCRGLTSIAIPEGVTSIDNFTFYNCTALISVTIPSSVTRIGDEAYRYCTSLTSAAFLGNAPSSFGSAVFNNTSPGFTIYYLSGNTGFTSPTWRGYPAIMIDEAVYPAAPWLLHHGFWYNTDLHQDTNGDGVSLLMAYALNLDPNNDLSGSMPQPILSVDSLSISFYGAGPGITYTVEMSGDLQNWKTDGVTLSPLDSDDQRTASVSREAPRRFLRLVVRTMP